MVCLAGLVAVAALAFGLADATAEEETERPPPLTHALLAGICGAFLTGDIFNMYVWFEVMLIASFGLLRIGGGRDELDGAIKYVGLNLIATVAFISGVGLLYGATGALNMADLHGRLTGAWARDADRRLGRLPHLRLRLEGGALPALLLAAGLLPHAVLHHLGPLLRPPDQGRVYALIRVFTLVFQVAGTADPDRPSLGRGRYHAARHPRGAGDDRGAPRARLLRSSRPSAT